MSGDSEKRFVFKLTISYYLIVYNCMKCSVGIWTDPKSLWERSGSVVESLKRDLGVGGSSLTGVSAVCP